jgi:hypothetical protein
MVIVIALLIDTRIGLVIMLAIARVRRPDTRLRP